MKEKNYTDLIGYKVGFLTVIRFDHMDNNSKQYWLCHCDACQNDTIKRRDVILSGKICACGCMSGRKNKSNGLLKNQYNLCGEYGIGYTSKGEEFYFDLEDYDKIKEYCWHINSKGYVVANINNTKILLHRFVTNAPDDVMVDHIHHNKKDNRKSELRLVNNSQNQMNTKTRKHSSPYTGISWHQKQKKWIAQIGINNTLKYLGIFSDIENAIYIRKQAEKEYFGEYANKSTMLS